MNHSKQLESILRASGWSQETLAGRLNVSFATVNSWIRGRSQPRKSAAENIRLLFFEIVGTDEVDLDEVASVKSQVLVSRSGVRTITSDEGVLRQLILYLTYNTNTIEGSTMTLSDTNAVLFNGRILTNRTQVEQLEARNHQTALLWLLSEMQSNHFKLTESTIVDLHVRLMNGILSDAGRYRRHSVRIMGTQVMVANYLKIPELMVELITEIQRPAQDLIAQIARTHALFEKIHPFSDGNGRVGRLIMLAQALATGITPPIVLRERRQAYYHYLQLAQIEGNSLPLELFLAQAVTEAHRLLFR